MTETEALAGYVWRPWKIVVIAASVLLVAGGAVTGLTGAGSETSAASDGGVTYRGVKSFGGGGPTLPVPPEGESEGSGEASAGTTPAGEDPWSPALLRGGFSFLVGFAVAYALRTFLRIAVFFFGVWAASLFLLASLGWVEVHWNVIGTAFDGWTDTLGAQFESAKTFITGSLPSAGMAGLGLFTGFKKG